MRKATTSTGIWHPAKGSIRRYRRAAFSTRLSSRNTVIVGRVCSGGKKKKDYDHKLPLDRHSSPLHSNITEPLPMPTSPELSARKFEENKISALKGTEVSKPVSNRKGTMTKAHEGHQGREWTRLFGEVGNIKNATHLCFKRHFHKFILLTLTTTPWGRGAGVIKIKKPQVQDLMWPAQGNRATQGCGQNSYPGLPPQAWVIQRP